MTKYLTWKGLIYHSSEACKLTINETMIEAASVITGRFEDKVYSVNYRIKINQHWETIFFEIKSDINGRLKRISYSSNGKGNWNQNGKPISRFTGCIDIDISVTPFTNSLPVNRLNLPEHAQAEISVLYVDVLGQVEKKVSQKYTRLSQSAYKYENIPNDFEAIISVDQQGLVIDYPGLFKKN
jgi:hypothetical protein